MVQPAFSAAAAKSRLLGGLNPQEKTGEERIAEVKENKKLEKLIGKYEKFCKDAWLMARYYDDIHFPKHLNETIYLLREFECTNSEINEFLAALKQYEHQVEHFHVVGIFISALVELSREKDFTLQLNHLDNCSQISCICYANTKNVQINGNVGSNACKFNSGILTINGDVGSSAGRCNAGTIIVNGNAAHHFCAENKGRVTLNGNAESGAAEKNEGIFKINGKASGKFAEHMYSGSLWAECDASSELGPVHGGKVFLTGRLPAIFPSHEFSIANYMLFPHWKIWHNGSLIIDSGARGWKLHVMHPILSHKGKIV